MLTESAADLLETEIVETVDRYAAADDAEKITALLFAVRRIAVRGSIPFHSVSLALYSLRVTDREERRARGAAKAEAKAKIEGP